MDKVNILIDKLVSSLEVKIEQTDNLHFTFDAYENLTDIEEKFTNDCKVILHCIAEYLEESVKEINNYKDTSIVFETDSVTMPLALGKELYTALVTLLELFCRDNGTFKKDLASVKVLSDELNSIYNSDVQCILDELRDPSAPEGKVC